MKRYPVMFTIFTFLFTSYFLMGRQALSQISSGSDIASSEVPVTTPTAIPSPAATDRAAASLASTEPTPTPFSANPFNYTPLPVDRGGPRNDIEEFQPLAASRTSAQVDDYITFTAGIKNVAPYEKSILSLCFESTDGNFGCVWGIDLQPGQTYTLSDVGSWVQGGKKTVWITWTQDGFNYYQPLHSKTVSVNILD